MKNYLKIFLSFITFLVLGALLTDQMLYSEKISLSKYLEKLQKNQIKEINPIISENGKVYFKDLEGTKFIFYTGNILMQNNIIEKSLTYNVEVQYENEFNIFTSILFFILSIAPSLIIIVFLYFLYFGKNNFLEEKTPVKKPKTRFTDVKGAEEAIAELQELVDFLKNPYKYHKIGAKIPRGCLLVGEPGTGKTLMAKAIAGEAAVPFFDASGPEFIELFVGMGAKKVRDLFKKAKEHAPCIIFIDEIDSIGKSRSKISASSNQEADQTLNQILIEMDGFKENEGIIVIGATNRVDILDKALLRPGRFDRKITIDLPDLEGRQDILKHHLSHVKHEENVDIKRIAKLTSGMSGADLMNIINEAALIAARKGDKLVNKHHIDESKDRIIMGLARKPSIMTLEDKKITAYHEAGHAILTHETKHNKIHKVTILPRGNALGMVAPVADKDDVSRTRAQMISMMIIAMGGRVAEEMIFGKDNITSGASSDIQYATRIAASMVRVYGMSDKLGRVNYENLEYVSSERHALIDSEISRFVEEAYSDAKKILTKNKENLHKLAKTLLEKETLTGDEVEKLLSLTE